MTFEQTISDLTLAAGNMERIDNLTLDQALRLNAQLARLNRVVSDALIRRMEE